MAFVTPIPLFTVSGPRPRVHHRQITAKAKKPIRANPSNPSSSKPSPPQPSITKPESLKTRLTAALLELNRGLSIDVDADVLTPEEAVVEDIIIALETLDSNNEPANSSNLSGTWQLLYTSSAITRYFGGVTGLQRLLPGGEIGLIEQVIDTEDGTSKYVENIKFEIPGIGDIKWVAVAEGRLRKTSAVRVLWDPEKVSVGWFRWFADSWKTLRAFQISDITYLDDTLRVTRGTTGSVHVYQRKP